MSGQLSEQIETQIGSEKNHEGLEAELLTLGQRRVAFENLASATQDEVWVYQAAPSSALEELANNVAQLTELHARLRFVMKEVSDLVRRV